MSDPTTFRRAETVDADEAASALRDIARTEQRTREALYYAGGSSILMLWGIAWAVGYVITYLSPPNANLAWTVINILGVAATLLIGYRGPRALSAHWDRRASSTFILLVAFGAFTQWLLGDAHWREISLFWATLGMGGYIVAGLWIGRFYILCGSVVIALSLAGYFWSGPWFPLWMAALGGGSLILGGLWLRRVGARG
ncbi:MAG TPA: hypothetical protein VEI03_00010 [Stellaceae bacterium]|nr:hypothetical protein [Stellaceae bacterium]